MHMLMAHLGAGNGGKGFHFFVAVSSEKEAVVGPLHWVPYCPETMYIYLQSDAMPNYE